MCRKMAMLLQKESKPIVNVILRLCKKMSIDSMLKNELKTVVPDFEDFIFWLSVTQGKLVDNKLLSFDHWPKNLEVRVGVWRDYYTGERMEEYARPW